MHRTLQVQIDSTPFTLNIPGFLLTIGYLTTPRTHPAYLSASSGHGSAISMLLPPTRT